jgi:pteridine reductase
MSFAAEFVSARNQRLYGTERPVAFVTGSLAPRVGRVVAEYLVAENFEAIFHGTHESPERVAKLAPGSFVLSGLVQDESQVEAWVTEIIRRFGRIDVLVNSAAIWDPKTLEATTAEDFLKYFQVNCLGTALTCKHFGLQMCSQATGGAIINIGDWAVTRPYTDFAAYFPSKGALPTLTSSMAVELAGRNPRVRVNAILPGPVLLADGISDEKQAQILKECLLRRHGTADDVAQAAIYLATAPFVTGVCLPVDGGRTIHAGSSADAVAHPEYKP